MVISSVTGMTSNLQIGFTRVLLLGSTNLYFPELNITMANSFTLWTDVHFVWLEFIRQWWPTCAWSVGNSCLPFRSVIKCASFNIASDVSLLSITHQFISVGLVSDFSEIRDVTASWIWQFILIVAQGVGFYGVLMATASYVRTNAP